MHLGHILLAIVAFYSIALIVGARMAYIRSKWS